MKTREKIANCALCLFNEQGVSHISTNHIAIEMDISPGNLYYHFKNKQEIIKQLLIQYQVIIESHLELADQRKPDFEDMWLYLHLTFERIWEYRFIYRDMNSIVSNDTSLKTTFKQIITMKTTTAREILSSLAQQDIMQANARDIAGIANNIALIATFWLSFQAGCGESNRIDDSHFSQGAYQVMSLIIPYLRQPERSLLSELSLEYLN